jgi:hypothetical protein
MTRTKLVAGAAVVAAFFGGPLGVAPAQAQGACDKINEPYDYPCEVAQDVREFVGQEADGILQFVDDLRYEAGELAVTVVCTVFPEQPACW